VSGARTKAIHIASSQLVTSGATVAAIVMFVGLGSQVLPPAFGVTRLPADGTLAVALLLNIALILFGWRRSKDLKQALEAYEQAERLAERNANTDPMTGLANRRELVRCLGEALEAKRGGTLLLLDLDHFKRVNDLHGHLAGDQLLRAVAEVLVRAAPDAACCARVGGDEFAVLLDGEGSRAAESVAEAILELLATPVFACGAQLQVSTSIGLASTRKLTKEEDVLRQSDVALYAAKRAGRNRFAWFDHELDRELTERLSMEEDMRAGIKTGEFVPFFQPLIDLESRELVGFETLARWRSPKRGLLEAEHFIEIAEATGLIAPLTMSVIEQALKDARTWPAHLKIAVNISPVQFRDAQLAEHIIKLLTETGFPASRLEIEITEASLLEDRDQVVTIIRSLKNLGVSVSLDDFGTGYASLAQVNNLPVDRIKIDKSFIATIVKSEQTAAIVATIASLGHTLNVPITAEGVESEQVRAALQKYGCTEAQGWLFGRAVSADSVRTFLGLRQPADAPPPPTPTLAPAPKAEEEEDGHRFTPRIRRSS
jgi:diguanylate cyclase (GGDEF)-like protein